MDELLIESVKQHEVLYNRSRVDYRDQYLRQECWEEIGRKLGITADKAKTNWDKLRRCYTNARNRRLLINSSQGTKVPLAWKFDQHMSFLLPHLEGRRTCTHFQESQNNNSDIPETTQRKLNSGKYEYSSSTRNQDVVEEDVDAIKIEQVETNENTLQNIQHNKNLKDLKRSDKPKQGLQNNAAAEIVKKIQTNADLRKRRYKYKETIAKKKPPYLQSIDDIDLFFLSMARMTKKLPKFEQTSVKIALSNAVLHAEQRSSERQLHYPSQTFVPTPLSSVASSPTMQTDIYSQDYLLEQESVQFVENTNNTLKTEEEANEITFSFDKQLSYV